MMLKFSVKNYCSIDIFNTGLCINPVVNFSQSSAEPRRDTRGYDIYNAMSCMALFSHPMFGYSATRTIDTFQSTGDEILLRINGQCRSCLSFAWLQTRDIKL